MVHIAVICYYDDTRWEIPYTLCHRALLQIGVLGGQRCLSYRDTYQQMITDAALYPYCRTPTSLLNKLLVFVTTLPTTISWHR